MIHFLFPQTNGNPTEKTNAESKGFINEIIVKIYHGEFDSAYVVSKRLRELDQHSAGLYDLIIYQAKNKEYELIDEARIDTFYRNCEMYIEELEDKFDENKTAKLAYLIGNAYLLMASEDNRMQSMFSAYSHSSSAVSYLEECLEINPDLHDAKLGLGFYKYWKSIKTKSIPFFTNEIELGLTYIDEAILYGEYAELTGKHQKVFVLNREKRYDEAYVLALDLIKKYPDSRPVQWAYAEALLKNKKYEEADDYYLKLYKYYKSISADFNVIEILYKRLLCKRTKNIEEAIGIAKNIVNYKLKGDDADRLSSKLDKVEDILDELKERKE